MLNKFHGAHRPLSLELLSGHRGFPAKEPCDPGEKMLCWRDLGANAVQSIEAGECVLLFDGVWSEASGVDQGGD